MTDPESPEILASASSELTVDETSDAALRAWAKDNGIEGVPASGKLSSAWRDQITVAQAAVLAADPKEEVSAETTSSGSFTAVETPETTTVTLTEEEPETTTDTTSPSGEASLSTEEPEAEAEEEPEESEAAKAEREKLALPEFETGEYRSVFQAPNTFVSSQAYTA